MPDYVVTVEAVDQIADMVKPQFKTMEADLAKEYPDRPEWAFDVGMALGMSVLLDNIEDPAERARSSGSTCCSDIQATHCGRTV